MNSMQPCGLHPWQLHRYNNACMQNYTIKRKFRREFYFDKLLEIKNRLIFSIRDYIRIYMYICNIPNLKLKIHHYILTDEVSKLIFNAYQSYIEMVFSTFPYNSILSSTIIHPYTCICLYYHHPSLSDTTPVYNPACG